MKTINDFNLNSKHDRCKARKAGFDVPKQKPGIKQQDFWFWVNVKNENECWPWLGKLNQWGYGRYRLNGFFGMAHRIAYEKTTGQNIKGLIAMHICDNPQCCNPKHIALGTHADNQADKVAKNRQAKGETNGQSILTEQQVIEARYKYKTTKDTYKKLADKYGVCKDAMQKAIRGINWKHI
jgi:hypothetical protein